MNAPASASGLFAATGRRPKGRPRGPLDYTPTVEDGPVEALVAAEGGRLGAFAALWEPAAGGGHMARALRRFGFRVRCSDLVDRGCGARIRDFYACRRPMAPAIVTNPPWGEAAGRLQGRWIAHALRLGVAFAAFLLPWRWPCAAGLAEIWARTPPARAYAMTWRIDWTGDGAPPIDTGWFVWDGLTPPGGTRLLTMERP